jgi:hypothetical protein
MLSADSIVSSYCSIPGFVAVQLWSGYLKRYLLDLAIVL